MNDNMKWDTFMPERLIPIFEYFKDKGQYLFLPELLESALFFNTATAVQLKNARIHRNTNHGVKKIIPNTFFIILAPSGVGKNASVSFTAEPFKDMYITFIDRIHSFTLNPNNRDNKNELAPQYIKMSHQFLPSGSSVQGVQKAAQTLTDLGFGGVSLYEDELGDNMMSMGQIFTKMKTAFDEGISYGDLNVSSGGLNYHTVDDICYNAMLMGSPGIFEQQPKLKEQLLSHFISGIARRSFIFHNTSYKKSENRNKTYETMSQEDIQIAKDYFNELRSFINGIEQITMPKEVYKELIEWDIQKEVLRENSDSILADNLGAPAKIERLAGVIAVLDLSQTITSEHLKYAISFTERIDATTEAAHRIKPIYEQIYDILAMRGFISRTELLKEVKGLTLKSLDDEIMLTTELASQLGNSIVIKEYSGIIKYKLERLTATKLDTVIMSINDDTAANSPDGFRKVTGDFYDMHKVICSTRRYSAGTFLNQYITNNNYLSDQNIIILDIDDGITIEEAKNLFKHVIYMIATTKSHQIAKDNKPACDRFRLILPTVSKFHLKPEVYSEMYGNLTSALGMEDADISCRNASRWYYGFEGEHWYNQNPEAELLDIRPFIPDTSENKTIKLNVTTYDISDYGDDDKVNRRRAGMLRWSLSQATIGNRNEITFRYGSFLKDIGLDFDNGIKEFNSNLSEPLGDAELIKIIRSIASK